MSSRFLLEGGWYSVEQCGRLLRTSTALIEAGDYGSAIGLAVLAIEELGKARILLDMWKRRREGETFDLESITTALEDHIAKLKKGQTLYPLTAPRGSGIEALVRTATTNPDTPEARNAADQLRDLALKRGKRTPDERHLLRLRGLYVDPDSSGTTWLRPAETAKDDALVLLTWAMNDYGAACAHLAASQGDLADVLKDWPERPRLPERVWPKPVVPIEEIPPEGLQV